MNQYSSYTDEHLIRAARKGNHLAYTQLMVRYQAKILQALNCAISDKVYVKDLSQDVMFKIYKYLPDFKGDCKFSTWLYRITQNTIKNYYRTMNQQNDVDLYSIDEFNSSFYSSPERLISNMELSDQLEHALSKLSEELRSCYGLFLFEGESYESIAQTLHCPIGTVRSRIYRARKIMAGFVNKA